MKHAGPDALARLETLLGQLRSRAALKEKTRGTFYRGGRAFLHFHEHGTDLFADLRIGGDFARFPATTPAQRRALLDRVVDLLGDGSAGKSR